MAAGTSTGICIATEKTFIVVIESPVWRKHHTSQVQFQKHPLSTGISRSDFFYVEACCARIINVGDAEGLVSLLNT